MTNRCLSICTNSNNHYESNDYVSNDNFSILPSQLLLKNSSVFYLKTRLRNLIKFVIFQASKVRPPFRLKSKSKNQKVKGSHPEKRLPETFTTKQGQGRKAYDYSNRKSHQTRNHAATKACL